MEFRYLTGFTRHFLLLLPAWLLLAMTACKKTPAEQTPEAPRISAAKVIELAHKPLKYGKDFNLDLNADGRNDLLFKVNHVAYDLNTKVKFSFLVYSTSTSRIAVNTGTEAVPVFTKGQQVSIDNFSGFEWYPAIINVLSEKNLDGGAGNWTGPFSSTDRRYLPIQLLQAGKYHTGWLELSTDQENAQVVLHRAGIAIEADMDVRAGE
ncbi:hypothetical protein [Pedobacter sp. SYP-B3415]|uniref:hypothetical protein n=1 Tax=Pedobacter sp. SYP-B3415 TaxID=2496641 RepID=UPI00101C753C|nr:hypothetical protein [Pedobacter sp. SYP-B3415]